MKQYTKKMKPKDISVSENNVLRVTECKQMLYNAYRGTTVAG